MVFENLLYVTSDDGFLYALNQQDGSLAWKHRGGPDHNKRLGNERMISRLAGARGGGPGRPCVVPLVSALGSMSTCMPWMPVAANRYG
ncbi:MAG: hypothetical protein R3C12_05335 [Planctomycetaceae bacterium]